MDRSAPSRSECATAVRTARTATFDVLSPAAAGECGEPAADAAAGRTLPGVPVLRQSPHGGHVGIEPQTHAAPDADSGDRSSLSESELEPASGHEVYPYLLRGVSIVRKTERLPQRTTDILTARHAPPAPRAQTS